MIITRKKPFETIEESIKSFKKVFIVGCGTCSTVCQTGGEAQVKEVAEIIGEKCAGYTVVESPCDARILRRDLMPKKAEVDSADAVLALCCGAGAQSAADFTGKIVVPGLDTLFIGKIERIGTFYERCRACTDCVLLDTGGICPYARCAKGLLNGPCGGQVDGKCEVGGYTRDCAWVLAYRALDRHGRLDVFMKYRPPRDRSKTPQEITGRK
ncbi:MAG: methylenetetrahydrofolate reductase C-terminal domain-containing protein [Candidatus Verstraetearchaeota archaeon]|nr:methylenetetrahydrofolate reductase C-terminal domain-containing protein [Candidatus Verstraetearchaeota archaeon]